MLCFQVLVNGELVSTAGADDIVVLSAPLTWAVRNSGTSPTSISGD